VTRIRVLITNHTLASRSGTETYVRDLALGLLRRNHQPVVYSPELGPIARELRHATVPVVDRIDQLGSRPDIIHGNDGPGLISALLHFPGVPAAFFCHSWSERPSQPPLFPRILRYVAVDELCRDRVTAENGVPDDRVRVLLNAVDLERFQPRPPLPERPRRALMYRATPTERSYVATLEAACRRAGVELDVGRGGEATPELLLRNYDLVFAKARCALEALAVGTAVVLCDVVGSGPMVTAQELNDLRRLNLGRRTLRAPVDADLLSEQIARYDPHDAAVVSSRIRETASRDALVDEILDLYREIADEYSGGTDGDLLPLEEARAAAAYIRDLNLAAKREVQLEFSLALRTRLRRRAGIAGRLMSAGRWARARGLLR